MKRRHFLHATCWGGFLGFSGLGLLTSCRKPTQPNLRAEPAAPVNLPPALDDPGSTILWYASLAPSTHNTQPWRVRILDSRQWIIEADQTRRLPAVDPENRELLLSLGAFAENLKLAAAHHGFQASFHILTNNPEDRQILKVDLKSGGNADIPLQVIENRLTLREGLQNSPLLPAHLQALHKLVPDHLFYFPNTTEHGACLARGTAEQFKVQSFRDEAQQELTHWLRLNPEAEKAHRDGLTLKGMGITGLKAWFLSHFVSPEDFLQDNFREKGVGKTRQQVQEGAGWFVLTSPGESVADWINCGRHFQQIALKAQQLGIGLHPMSQYLEEQPGQEAIRSNHRSGFRPQFLIRCGYVSTFPKPVSPRRPVEWFVRS